MSNFVDEALRFLKTQFKPEPIDHVVEERHYKVIPGANGPALGELILPPVKPALKLASLTGFRDAFIAGVDADDNGKRAVQVIDHETVASVSLDADSNGRRHEWLRATSHETNQFPFDTYQTPEPFLINLQRGFLPTDEIIQLQRLASSLSNDSSISTQDDGMTQSVTVKQGAVSYAPVDLPKRIKLFPYRTFREVDPVASEFLVRLKGETGQLPQIALIEIDSSTWKHDTALLVKRWLVAELPVDTVVIA